MKYKANGSLERYKVQSMAKEYMHIYGIDYKETFASVAKMTTVRILLALTIHFDWKLTQYDVDNTILHGNLDEEIYMHIFPLVLKTT